MRRKKNGWSLPFILHTTVGIPTFFRKDEAFHLNGYVILPLRDIKKVHIKKDKYNEILQLEHVLDSVAIPEIDLTDWQTVFLSLKAQGHCVIVENERAGPEETEFIIVKIHKAGKRSVSFLHFDSDGVWQEDLFEFSHPLITTVRFGERYTDIFIKHLEAPPVF